MDLTVRLLTILVALSISSGATAATIYGPDNRQDLYQVQDPRLAALADASVALFPESAIQWDDADNIATLGTIPMSRMYNLCPGERFSDQPSGPECSGALISDDLVLTAGHCVSSIQQCKATWFVFGFAIKTEGGQPPSTVPYSEMAGCAGILASRSDNSGADFAIVELDRHVPQHHPLPFDFDSAETPAVGTPLAVMGYPSGLPLKIAAGAQVLSVQEGYFVADLDTFGGNSGSPVIDLNTMRPVGVLVRGDGIHPDYARKPGTSCQVAYDCDSDPVHPCLGEQATMISAILPLIPKHPPNP